MSTINFPPAPSEDECQTALQRGKVDVSPLTLCQACGSENWGFRLGCQCGGEVTYRYKTYDGRYLELDVDFCEYRREQ